VPIPVPPDLWLPVSLAQHAPFPFSNQSKAFVLGIDVRISSVWKEYFLASFSQILKPTPLASENRPASLFLTTIFLLCHNRFLVHKMARTNPSRKPAFMTQDSRAAEKLGGSTPSLSEDSRTMLSLISLHFKEKPRLASNLRYWVVSFAPVLLVCLAPFAVLLFIVKNNIRPHYASLDLLPVFAGCWAIFALWITLHKGMGSLLLGEDTAGAAWLLLGLVNVIAAFGTLLVLCIS
jgi:hypothetical protein